jgi:hypothetical protein
MAITSITTLAGLRTRIRFISGIKAEEIDDTDLDLVISIATEWFTEQTGLTYAVATADAAYDNAVMYYSCYLGSIAQNGVGIEQIRIGDVFIQYDDDEPYNKYLEMANDAIMAKQGLSIQTTSYNASSSQGDVDWKKNIDGSDGTQNVRQKPRGM